MSIHLSTPAYTRVLRKIHANIVPFFFTETLRKHPPAPILNRECTKNYKIPGTDIFLEKGISTIIPTLGLHHDPKYYPDPERFDPERFSEEEKAKRHHYVYLPFGEGPRICIGESNQSKYFVTMPITFSAMWKTFYVAYKFVY
jgi:cytochrome P450